MIQSMWLYSNIVTSKGKFIIKTPLIKMDKYSDSIMFTFDSSDPDDFNVFREGTKALKEINDWQWVYTVDERVFHYVQKVLSKQPYGTKILLKLITPTQTIERKVSSIELHEDENMVEFMIESAQASGQ